MHARECCHSQWIFYHSRFAFEEADVQVRFYGFRFGIGKVDDSGMVGVYAEMAGCGRASS